jgi:dTDP-4-dehydrorhamnose reductase
MRILVLGGTGILGNEVVDVFKKSTGFDVYWTSRTGRGSSITFNVTSGNLTRLIEQVDPELVINATVVKHWRTGNLLRNAFEMYRVNSWFPRKLSRLALNYRFKVIHLSTNAVFSGIKGNYQPKDFPFPASYYGFTKRLGESQNFETLIIRTSFVEHRELWNSEKTNNSKNAIPSGKEIIVFSKDRWNGVTHSILANLILGMAKRSEFLHGLYHFVPIGSLSTLEFVSWRNKNQWSGMKNILEKNRIWKRKLTLVSDPADSLLLWSLAGYHHVPLINEIFTSVEKAQ